MSYFILFCKVLACLLPVKHPDANHTVSKEIIYRYMIVYTLINFFILPNYCVIDVLKFKFRFIYWSMHPPSHMWICTHHKLTNGLYTHYIIFNTYMYLYWGTKIIMIFTYFPIFYFINSLEHILISTFEITNKHGNNG